MSPLPQLAPGASATVGAIHADAALCLRLAAMGFRIGQRIRMVRMRQTVRERNIYWWAGRLLRELSRIPEEALGKLP